MPYLLQEKLLFIHIPKTGGTSIEQFFGMCDKEALWFDRWDRDQNQFLKLYGATFEGDAKMSYEPQHYSFAMIRKFIADIDSYFTFSFVRHPYTRLLSEYFWAKNIQYRDTSDFDGDEFASWANHFLSSIDSSHKEPQVFFVDDRVHFIGRFENLEEDMSKLLQQLTQFNPVFEKFIDQCLPLTNQSGKSKEKLVPLMSAETKELIQSVYQDDFHAFGYSTDFV
jgi:hypothetical protein